MNKIVGRPRSQAADEAIVFAATKIFFKQHYADVSMGAIATEAGVSKATLYRRWPDKATLAVEVLIKAVLQQRLAYSGDGYREHLMRNLKALRNMLDSDYADVIVCIIAEAQNKPDLRRLFYQHFLQPVQAIGDEDLQCAIDNGEIKTVVDKDLLFDQLFGFFYYRLLIAHRAVTDKDIEIIVNGFMQVAGE